ncbi:CHASE2 domain-containing protein [Roseibium aggregatum]|uniref:Adenylate/guanylate cyclase domain-containing protein n=1 Tax=Roseibium aggregatum TaxID=187304 RepID=A0A926P104_9HYPH|nr:adenylate/guanylate cyclase domain-containing protein [Roseibium aggregatum]MBD1547340.1 adenylate/guanylate cyclase domain-containing protein [Roseibium aggregatum]
MRGIVRRLTGKRALVTVAAILGLTAATGLRAINPDFVTAVRELTFDYYQRFSPRPYAAAPVRVADIDEASIAKYGQWPWPRTRLAELVTTLTDMGAAVIAFDIVFSEPDRTSPTRITESLSLDDAGDPQALKALLDRLPDNDESFAAALAQSPSVLGFAARRDTQGRAPASKSGFAYGGTDPVKILPAFPSALPSLAILENEASGIGGISLSAKDQSGVVRRAPLLFSDGKQLYPGLAVEALRVAQGAKGLLVKTTGASGQTDTGNPAITDVKIGAFTVPTTADGEMWVYFDHERPERYVSVKDILDPEKRAEVTPLVEGQIVFVGTSAAGLRDIRATPLGELVPGVTIHAQATEQIINGNYLTRPDWANGAETLATFLVGIVVILALPMIGAIGTGLLGAGAAAAMIGGSYYFFLKDGLLIDPIYPSFATFMVFAVTTALLYFLTEREKRFVRHAFSQYLSPDLVTQLENSPEQLVLGGEMRPMTILFMDIRGFTPISEQLTPTELVSFLNTLLSPLSDAIQAEQGTIDKYIGDSIMAFWNAPLMIEAHASHACRAALDMLATVDRLNEEDAFGFKARKLKTQTVKIGIGLNSGEACVGNMGSDKRFNYSVIGDAVNVASRIESSCKAVGAELLVSDETRNEAPEFAYLEAGEIPLKGKSEAVRLFALVGSEKLRTSEGFRKLSRLHADLMEALRDGEPKKAERLLIDCRSAAPDHLQHFYDRFGERIAALEAAKVAAGDAAQ